MLYNDNWIPNSKDYKLIRQRIQEKNSNKT